MELAWAITAATSTASVVVLVVGGGFWLGRYKQRFDDMYKAFIGWSNEIGIYKERFAQMWNTYDARRELAMAEYENKGTMTRQSEPKIIDTAEFAKIPESLSAKVKTWVDTKPPECTHRMLLESIYEAVTIEEVARLAVHSNSTVEQAEVLLSLYAKWLVTSRGK